MFSYSVARIGVSVGKIEIFSETSEAIGKSSSDSFLLINGAHARK